MRLYTILINENRTINTMEETCHIYIHIKKENQNLDTTQHDHSLLNLK